MSGGCTFAPAMSPDDQEAASFQFRLLNTATPMDVAVAIVATNTSVPLATSTALQTATSTTAPTATSTTAPTDTPTAEPTNTPTTEPTDTPTAEPTDTPTSESTNTPTDEPTDTPTAEPTDPPTAEPTSTSVADSTNSSGETEPSGQLTVRDLLQNNNTSEDAIEANALEETTPQDSASGEEEVDGSSRTVLRLGDLLDSGDEEAETGDAEQRQFVSIVTDGRNLNVRRGPGTGFGILTSIEPGIVLEVVETSSDGNWLRVDMERFGSQGWVGIQFTRPAEIPEGIEATTSATAVDATPTEEGSTNGASETNDIVSTVPIAVTEPENMNVRRGPGTIYAVVTVAPAGTQYEILGVNPEGDWYQVRIPDVEEPGWLFAPFTETFGPADEIPILNDDEIPEPPEQATAATETSVVAGPSVAAPPPSGGGFFGYGLQAHMLGGGIDEATHATQTLGFNWLKQQVEWRIFEGSPGALDFSELRRIVDSAGSRGISVLFSVVNAPDWAREGGFDPDVGGPPADPQTYANFVGRLAGDFCGSPMKAIEVWNEQNLHYEWGNRPLSPVDYMNLLRPAYASIKAACPTMLVISGALTPTGGNGNLAMDDFAYLEGMYQNGLAAYSDGIGAHPSGYNVPPSVRHEQACTVIQETGNFFNGACDNPHHSWSFRSSMEGYRNIMVVYGDTNKRIWPTEFGWAAGGAFHPAYAYAEDNDFNEQARWTVEAFTMMRNWGWVGPAFLWNLNFRVVADGTEKAQWGIVRNDYSPLPIYSALQAMPK
ncbi:MAG: SH3 domain-containing protein [Chloroflexota bacterium]